MKQESRKNYSWIAGFSFDQTERIPDTTIESCSGPSNEPASREIDVGAQIARESRHESTHQPGWWAGSIYGCRRPYLRPCLVWRVPPPRRERNDRCGSRPGRPGPAPGLLRSAVAGIDHAYGGILSNRLVLFAESLNVGLPVRIKEIFAALLPSRLEFERGNVPVWPAFPAYGAQILPELLAGSSAEEPVPVVDLINHETGFENDRVRDHRIVDRVRVFGDVQVLLNDPAGVGEERPMGPDSAAIFAGLAYVVGADRDQLAVANLNFACNLTLELGTAVEEALEDKRLGYYVHRPLRLYPWP